jgi:hypothetical protein
MAELMSEAGYATGMFGKWHIGDVPGRFATDQGFDEWYGVANSTDESEYSSQFQYDPGVGTKPMIVEAYKGEVPRDVKPYDIQARREIDAELNSSKDGGLGLVARHDSRDNIFSPNSGHYGELALTRYDDIFGGVFDYTHLKASSLSWWGVLSNVVLGVKLS